MISVVLSKHLKENDTVIFTIYKSGIDDNIKKQFEEEENRVLNEEKEEEIDFYDYKSVYSRQCEAYWKNNFDEWNNEFKKKLKLQKSYKYEEEKKNYILNKIYVYHEDRKYILLYDYEVSKDETIVIYFHLYREGNKEDKYDKFLEKFKLEIKDFWIAKTKVEGLDSANCYWVEDTQSEKLSFETYPIINKIENRLRVLINKVMIHNYGLLWNDIFDKDTELKSKCLKRCRGYKKDINSFANINIFLLNLDANELKEIMKYKKKNNNNKLNDDISEPKSMAYKYEPDVLNRCFENLFDYCEQRSFHKETIHVSSKFLKDWNKLCKYRNHIAHNKIIDYKLYSEVKRLINKVYIEIEEAEKEFNAEISDNYMKDMEVMDQITPGDTITLTYSDRIERERKIYKEIISFIMRMKEIQYGSSIDIQLGKSFDFDELYNDYTFHNFEKYTEKEREGFILFLKDIVQKGFVEIMKIEDNSKVNLVQIKIEKCEGSELTNYMVEVKLKNNKEFKIYISHSEYHFVANNCAEDDAFLGGNWDGFCKNVQCEILEII